MKGTWIGYVDSEVNASNLVSISPQTQIWMSANGFSDGGTFDLTEDKLTKMYNSGYRWVRASASGNYWTASSSWKADFEIMLSRTNGTYPTITNTILTTGNMSNGDTFNLSGSTTLDDAGYWHYLRFVVYWNREVGGSAYVTLSSWRVWFTKS